MSLLEAAFTQPDFTWNARTARHLLNRAGFGVPPSAVAKLAAMKPADAVAAFVDFERFPDPLPVPDWLPKSYNYRELREMAANMTEDEKRRLRQQRTREAYDAMSRLQVWWLKRMCYTQRPLEEKLALFWHGHFATSAEKVRDPQMNYDINSVFRRHGAGNFQTLVSEVGRSPAMLRYLDQAQSKRGKPNENWSRELMELFTLGIGNYTEQDIKEAARSFTGWTERQGKFVFGAAQHDRNRKTFLGKEGHFDGDDIIAIILQQPACAEFICRKMWCFFAYDDPEPEIVQGLAKTFREARYEIRPVLRQIFSSRAFYSDKAYASQIKSPAQLVVNLIMQLETPLEERPPVAQLAMRAMGQSLFSPPNVKGWDGGRAWINTNTLLIRYNYANYLVSGVVPDFGRMSGPGSGQMMQQLRAAMERKSRAMGRGTGRRDGMEKTAPSMEENDDSMMMAGEAQAVASAPTGQDAMSPDNPSTTLYGALRRRRGQKPSKEMQAMSFAPFQVREHFTRYDGLDAGELVDRLAEYFIGFPLEPVQRERLVAALTKSVKRRARFSASEVPEADMRATVQLLLSTAEYQVC